MFLGAWVTTRATKLGLLRGVIVHNVVVFVKKLLGVAKLFSGAPLVPLGAVTFPTYQVLVCFALAIVSLVHQLFHFKRLDAVCIALDEY